MGDAGTFLCQFYKGRETVNWEQAAGLGLFPHNLRLVRSLSNPAWVHQVGLSLLFVPRCLCKAHPVQCTSDTSH